MIEIFDLSGKVVAQKIASDYLTHIDMSDLNEGVYILKYEDTTLKVVKQ